MPALAVDEVPGLRLATAGSVDDGKSTLIGRLLHDSKAIMADQLEQVAEASRRKGGVELDLALLTDGLRAEREQGITIDVAYRYFATPRRRFVLADTPGHAQYTRNMVTGASTAEVAVVLVDVRHGLTEQSRRHLAITALLGIREVVLCVNKMDLVGWSEEAFDAVVRDHASWAAGLGDSAPETQFVPVSALLGDNIVEPSANLPWYAGPPLLELLETIEVPRDVEAEPSRMPVQWVIRPHASDYRAAAGRVTSGVLRVGDEVVVAPDGIRTTIAGIDGPEGELDAAPAGLSVAVRLSDDVDVARGVVLAGAAAPPSSTRELSATLCWMAEEPARAGGRYLVKHGTRTTRAKLVEVVDQLDVLTLERKPADGALALNDLGRVTFKLAEEVASDPYGELPGTGAFIVLDEQSGDTLAAGMVGR